MPVAPALLALQALRFVVDASPALLDAPRDGRVFVVVAREAAPEPRLRIGRTGMDQPLVVARDARLVRGGSTVLDQGALAFPLQSLRDLAPGEYFVQALFDSNRDVRSLNAPGNLYSSERRISLDPKRGGTVPLRLTERIPEEELPPGGDLLRYVKIPSPLLSSFHGRPMFLRAGVLLPRGYDEDPGRRYPLRVHIGGYGSSFRRVKDLMAEGSAFRKTWLADETPRMLLVYLDGDGPYGDSYQVNSANNGPYGDAVTQELIPHVEGAFRAIGTASARFLEGGSTGGWVSLALQVFYPDLFNGAWAGFPDPVDFRAYQLVNIYQDENAYLNAHGFERPSARDAAGDVLFTIRHECQMENVMGRGDSYTTSGSVWGAWNAVYGPRGGDGRPLPLWDPRTGRIDRTVAEQWKKYDLRLVLESAWPTLGPKLRGKIHIWVGENDDYFLDNAVRLLDAFLSVADPPYEGTILYGAGGTHGWQGIGEVQMMRQMADRLALGAR
jgi:S-formylglutathione hydrolase FrmB